MKVLYAIQGTGNGHASRAKEVIPALREHADVDIAFSSGEPSLKFPDPIKYQLTGVGFRFGQTGGIDYTRTARELRLLHFIKEISRFPADEYDLIINDFEPVTAWAGRAKDVPVVALSNQASFLSAETPRASPRSYLIEKLFRWYAPSNTAHGIHFDRYDDSIHTPLIRRDVRAMQTSDNGRVLVYLPAYSSEYLIQLLEKLEGIEFDVFDKHCQHPFAKKNVSVFPLSENFLPTMASCRAVLTGAGFETSAEAIFMGKKLMVVPLRGQYEQACNAEALSRLGVAVTKKLDMECLEHIDNWYQNVAPLQINYPDEIEAIVEQIIHEREQELCGGRESFVLQAVG